MPTRAKGRHYPIEISAVAWLDLLGYGSMLDEAGFDPSSGLAQRAVGRLKTFQNIVASSANRLARALIINDGVALVRELSPRSRSVTFDFVARVFDIHRKVNAADFEAGYPGARLVFAVGPRLRVPDAINAERTRLANILRRLREGSLAPEQAVQEAFRCVPVAGQVPDLQANFAFTKAYLADQAGGRAGLSGPRFFLDSQVFDSPLPDWISVESTITWSERGLNARFLVVAEVDCDTNPASPNVDKLDKGRGSRGRYLEAAWLIGWPDGNEHDSKVDRPFMGALTLTCLPVPVGADPVPSSVA